MQSTDRKAIEHFVRVTLGCKCPEEVFRSIGMERVGYGDDGAPYIRLTIGDRLLIYVLEPTNSGEATDRPAASASPDMVAELAHAGVADRDSCGFNRFRLVIASGGSKEPTNAAAAAFASATGADDRAYLHVVEPAQLPPDVRSR